MSISACEFDVAVIGAGIHGAGVAQACAAAGWRTLVLEKNDQPALGTSSKSSKLIHGGLRYLETLQFSLVRECLREKHILCRIAPQLVKPAKFIIPVYATSKRSPFWIRLGLWLYYWMGFPHNRVRGLLPRSDWAMYPQLRQEGLLALFEYDDAQTDDALLTRAVLQSARAMGASVKFNSDIEHVTYTPSQGYSIMCRDTATLTARCLVNATGPWVNNFSTHVSPEPPILPVNLVQGTHIVLDRPATNACFYMESPDDRRALFVLPWYGKVLVGTTEKLHTDVPDACAPTQEEMDYLLRAYNYYFPDSVANSETVIGSFAGLRVLPVSHTNANKRARDTRLVTSEKLPGYVAVYGGKLTAYRATAEQVADLLALHLPVNSALSTRTIPLTPEQSPGQPN